MASITIRNLDDNLKQNLRVRAAHHSRSMEDEARDILRSALSTKGQRNTNLAKSIHSRFAEFGGVNIDIQPHELIPEPPDFGT